MSQPTITPADQAIASRWITTTTGDRTTTFAHLGWVDLDGTEWTIHAEVNPDRYAKYASAPELAAYPSVFRAPGVNLLTYPVASETETAGRLLFHAPAFLNAQSPTPMRPLDWHPRLLESGHTIAEATAATIEDTTGPYPVIARVDQAFTDLANGNLDGTSVLLGEGTDRRLVVPVLSTDTTAADVFDQLAESRRFS